VTGPQASIECLFCNITQMPADLIPWHDTPLVTQPGVGGAIAALGAFVPGYVLVFPSVHVESIRRIPRPMTDSFNAFANKVARAIAQKYEPVTIFEHGSCAALNSRRSACLTHAHLHIIPGTYRLLEKIGFKNNRTSHEDNGAWTMKSNYLFIQEPDERPQYYPDLGVSQFFRKIIAGRLGISDQWDWLMFPELDNVRTTIDQLRDRLL
jgi:diadenosine tetraphosphate (Ap4A) HIT family hydrolase